MYNRKFYLPYFVGNEVSTSSFWIKATLTYLNAVQCLILVAPIPKSFCSVSFTYVYAVFLMFLMFIVRLHFSYFSCNWHLLRLLQTTLIQILYHSYAAVNKLGCFHRKTFIATTVVFIINKINKRICLIVSQLRGTCVNFSFSVRNNICWNNSTCSAYVLVSFCSNSFKRTTLHYNIAKVVLNF